MATTRTIEDLQTAIINAIKRIDVNQAEEFAKELLSQGGNLEFTDSEGLTPILLAAKSGWGWCIDVLIKLGANVAATDRHGNGVLHLAAEVGELREAFNALTINRKPFDVTATNNLGQTVIHASFKYHPLINPVGLQFLENFANENHIDFSKRDNNGTLACNMNITTESGVTPLSYAAVTNSNLPSVKFLIEHGADLTARNKYKNLIWQTLLTLRPMNDPVLEYLRTEGKVTEYELQLFEAHRQLFFAIDAPRINRQLESVDKPLLYREGGQPAESVRFLLAHIKQFNDDPTFLANIHAAIENFDKYNGSLLFAGTEKHLTLAGITDKKPPMKQLCLYDSGYFSVTAPGGGIYSVQVLEFDEKHTQKVIELLRKSKRCQSNESRDILYNQIPQLTGSQYTNRTQKKPFKRGMCFYDNFKTMLLDNFILKHGELKGRLIYKKLDIFLHQSALDNFAQIAKKEHPRRENILRAGKDIIEEKQRKLQTLYVKLYADAIKKNNQEDVKTLQDPELLKILNLSQPDVLLQKYQEEILMIETEVAKILTTLREILDKKDFANYETHYNLIDQMLEKLKAKRSLMDDASFQKYIVGQLDHKINNYPITNMFDLLNTLSLAVLNDVRSHFQIMFTNFNLIDLAYKKTGFMHQCNEQINRLKVLNNDHDEPYLVKLFIEYYNQSKPEKMLPLASVRTFTELLREIELKIDDSLKAISQKGLFGSSVTADNENSNTLPHNNTKTFQ